MKLSLIVLLLLSAACAKDKNACDNPVTGTATLNGTTQTLVNGLCSEQLTPGTLSVNGKTIAVQHASFCGTDYGYLYNEVLYNSGTVDATSPTGFIKYPDNYYITQSTPTTQCWIKITGGKLDSHAENPTF
jgi:hypothetical protein